MCRCVLGIASDTLDNNNNNNMVISELRLWFCLGIYQRIHHVWCFLYSDDSGRLPDSEEGQQGSWDRFQSMNFILFSQGSARGSRDLMVAWAICGWHQIMVRNYVFKDIHKLVDWNNFNIFFWQLRISNLWIFHLSSLATSDASSFFDPEGSPDSASVIWPCLHLQYLNSLCKSSQRLLLRFSELSLTFQSHDISWMGPNLRECSYQSFEKNTVKA